MLKINGSTFVQSFCFRAARSQIYCGRLQEIWEGDRWQEVAYEMAPFSVLCDEFAVILQDLGACSKARQAAVATNRQFSSCLLRSANMFIFIQIDSFS